jgi:glycosyltransferase involved in cell wall biosynthesis
MMKSINIIGYENGIGLSRDINILSNVLQDAGFLVAVNGILKLSNDRLRQLPYDVNLFLEVIKPSAFPFARANCLIPNQEWLDQDQCGELAQLDRVLCKTRYAQSIFDRLECKTEFISFTSIDRIDGRSIKDHGAFFHLAGKSRRKKGTETIIDLWMRHPEWPPLKIIQDSKFAQPVVAQNIEHITEYIDDRLLRQYQNSHGVHLCASESEGFGHYIVEAMSCKAVIITTNAPPMNELVTSERGVLTDYRHTKAVGLGISYYVDIADLQRKIEKVLGMGQVERERLGEGARDWYQQNDKFFRRRIVETLRDI